jgi:hypothetical protein
MLSNMEEEEAEEGVEKDDTPECIICRYLFQCE